LAEALAGVRVLELGSMLAGPFVGTMLADFGAEVVKLEKPGQPDALREWPPHRDGEGLWWKTMSRGKLVATLDISVPEGRDLALRLAERSDVVIENFRPGTLVRWGLGPEALASRLPRVVWMRVSGYGQDGPMSRHGGYATIAEAFSGLASITGWPDRGPQVSAFPLGDYLAGIFGAFGVLAALRERDRGGMGQVVDVSLFEPLLRILESAVVRWDQTGQLKPRLGNQMEEDVPRNVYATADGGHVAVSCGSQRIFDNLADAMGMPGLKRDPHFASMAARVANREAIDRTVAQWFAQNETAAALTRLAENGVVAGPVNDLEQVCRDPHVAARGAIASIDDPVLGTVRMPAPVPKLSSTPGKIRWTGQSPGADNDHVFGTLLGLAASEIDALRGRRII
jgi:crotonobetainyl-CoA:carnitine CoA-transferase CaiB-like acyl-CoA transferase